MTDLKFALRSLWKAKGLTFTVVFTLALSIGANAAIFSVVRSVLLKPLVNRDQDSLIYIHQSARGIGAENANFSVPELHDLQARVKTLTAFEISPPLNSRCSALRSAPFAPVSSAALFRVMGLKPVVGRLPAAGDDGPRRKGGGADLSLRQAFHSDPKVIGTNQIERLAGDVVGVLEPSVPYPLETGSPTSSQPASPGCDDDRRPGPPTRSCLTPRNLVTIEQVRASCRQFGTRPEHPRREKRRIPDYAVRLLKITRRRA